VYKTICHKGELTMPSYGVLYIDGRGLEIKLKPRGFFRNVFKKWEPYLTGDVLDVKLVVKSSSNTAMNYSYSWQLQDLLPEKNFRVVTQGCGSFMTTPKGTTEVKLRTHLIQYEAEYHLIATVKSDGNEEGMKTLLNFYAMARDVYHTKWLTGLMSGFVGAIIGLAVGLLINWVN